MKKDEVIALAGRRGLCAYEEFVGRKILYKVKIPIFSEGQEIPTANRDELVRDIREVKKMADQMWKDEKYRKNVTNWLEKY